jgi:hypothetical protein
MTAHLELIFPALRGTECRVTSPRDTKYNCIAWAAGDTTQWWWPVVPDPLRRFYWPAGVPREETLEAFRQAFATLGYEVCNDDRLEEGYEKVAIFALMGVPRHAARQLPDGRWTSKLGEMEDIEHDLHDLTGMVYGSVALVMKRPRPTDVPPQPDETHDEATPAA